MAPAAESPKSFHLYSSLPLELRIQIWQESLPSQIKPAVFKYKRGCWWARHLTDADVGYEHDSVDGNLVLEFRHGMLGASRFDVPLAGTTQEARDAALSWAARHGIEVVPGEPPIFVRPFHPELDILYVAQEDWDSLLREPLERPWELEMLRDKQYSDRCEVYQMAVPEALLWRRDSSDCFALHEVFDSFSGLKVLYVVRDPQPDFAPSCSGTCDASWRWEVHAVGGREMTWNGITRGWHIGAEVREREDMNDEEIHQRLLGASEELQRAFGECIHRPHGFVIRVVSLEAGSIRKSN